MIACCASTLLISPSALHAFLWFTQYSTLSEHIIVYNNTNTKLRESTTVVDKPW